MVGFTIQSELNGRLVNDPSVTVKQVAQRQKQRLEKLKQLNVPLTRASVHLDRWVQKNFKTEGGNVGGWLPLAKGGRHIKGKGLDSSAKLLQDTGRLRASFSPFATRDNAGIYSDLDYSEHHEEGQGVPVRRMLPKWIEVKADVNKIMKDYSTGVANAGK